MDFNKLYHVIPLRVFLQTKNELSLYVTNTPFDDRDELTRFTYCLELRQFLYANLSKNVLLQVEQLPLSVDFLGRDNFDYIHICLQSNHQQFYPDNPASFTVEQEIIKLAFIRELKVDTSFLQYQIPVLSLTEIEKDFDNDDYGSDWYN